MPHYRYKLRKVEAVQVLDNGDILLRLACGHTHVHIGYVNTHDPNRWISVTADDAMVEVGRRRQCIICGGDFGNDAQGIVVRDRWGCGGDTFIAQWFTWTKPCARCKGTLDVPAILAEIQASQFTQEITVRE